MKRGMWLSISMLTLTLIVANALGSKPKNGHKDLFDPHTRGARTSGPRKDGFLQTFHTTCKQATCVMEQSKSIMKRMNIQ